MSTDVQRAVQFANPLTGEVLTLASPDADLGAYLRDVREFKSVIQEHIKMVEREILRRQDHNKSWTTHAGPLKITGASPQPTEEWDGGELREALLRLMDDGELPIEAVDAAVEIVLSYKVKKAGVNALRKGGGLVADTVNGLAREVEKDRRVSVSRA